MVKLSGVIITFNEEQNIERCLASLVDVVDEIIVLDSFSTDRTEEICKQFNVKFFQHKFDGYTKQKNRAIDYAENDYILSLDADEVLSGELQNSLQKVKEKAEFDAYDFNRLNIYCGKPIKRTGWYPDRKIRLWNKQKGKWIGDLIHEVVKMNSGIEVKFLKGDLLHYSFNSISQHISQINKFSDIKAEQDLISGRKSSIFNILFKPLFKFVIIYIYRLGFLDGYFGFIIAVNSAHFTFLRYVKLKELYKKNHMKL